MKSAYELAMERLQRESPDATVSLTEEQKKALADIDTRYKAKKAEKEVFLQKQILQARKARDLRELEMLETQLRNERLRLDEACEAEKNKIRQQTAS